MKTFQTNSAGASKTLAEVSAVLDSISQDLHIYMVNLGNFTFLKDFLSRLPYGKPLKVDKRMFDNSGEPFMEELVLLVDELDHTKATLMRSNSINELQVLQAERRLVRSGKMPEFFLTLGDLRDWQVETQYYINRAAAKLCVLCFELNGGNFRVTDSPASHYFTDSVYLDRLNPNNENVQQLKSLLLRIKCRSQRLLQIFLE